MCADHLNSIQIPDLRAKTIKLQILTYAVHALCCTIQEHDILTVFFGNSITNNFISQTYINRHISKVKKNLKYGIKFTQKNQLPEGSLKGIYKAYLF